jgi:cell division septum initiation protein DivIVA
MDKETAVRAIRKLAIQYEAMKDAADLMESLASYDQAVAEAKARIDKARAEEGGVLAKVSAAKDALQKANHGAAVVLVEADAAAARVAAEARSAADKLTTDAGLKAKEMLAGAQARADEAVRLSREVVAAVETERKDKQAVVGKLVAEIAAKSAELAVVEGRIMAARERIAAFTA